MCLHQKPVKALEDKGRLRAAGSGKFPAAAGKPGGETLPDDIAALIEKWKVPVSYTHLTLPTIA